MNTRKIKLKNNKSAAIVCLGTRISLDSINVRSVELVYAREYIMKILGRERVDYVSRKIKSEPSVDFYKDAKDVDFNDYDEIYIYNARLNPFGGLFKEEALITFEKLYNFDGEIYYILGDPNMPPMSFANFLMYKNKLAKKQTNEYIIASDNEKANNEYKITKEIVENWNEKVWHRTKVAFCGLDYELYYNTYNELTKNKTREFENIKPVKEWFQFELFEYFGVNEKWEEKTKDYDKDIKYDLMYFGNDRHNGRNKIVKNYFDLPDVKKLFIGFDPQLENTDVEKYLPHDKLFKTMGTSCLASIIVGDMLQWNNSLTPRFFELMLLDIIGFIDINYDNKKVYMKNEFLKDFLYVSSKEELKKKIEQIKENPETYKKIIKLQRQEIENQFNRLKVEKNDTLEQWTSAKNKPAILKNINTKNKKINKIF